MQQLLDEAGLGAGKEQWCRDREDCSSAKLLKREHGVPQRIVRVLNMKKRAPSSKLFVELSGFEPHLMPAIWFCCVTVF